jgi:hypothetical protein
MQVSEARRQRADVMEGIGIAAAVNALVAAADGEGIFIDNQLPNGELVTDEQTHPLACHECGRFQMFVFPEAGRPEKYSRVPGFVCARHSGSKTSAGDARRVEVVFGVS